MADIMIHVFHTGEVCVAPDLPFGDCIESLANHDPDIAPHVIEL